MKDAGRVGVFVDARADGRNELRRLNILEREVTVPRLPERRLVEGRDSLEVERRLSGDELRDDGDRRDIQPPLERRDDSGAELRDSRADESMFWVREKIRVRVT